MKKNLLLVPSLMAAFSVSLASPPRLTSEQEFAIAVKVANELEAKGELDGLTKHEVVKRMLAASDLHYECERKDFATITYDRCVTSFDTAGRFDDRNGGWSAGDWARSVGVYVGGRIAERVTDRALDHAESFTRREIERTERVDRERRERDRQREADRNRRCNHSVPSYREGDCA